MYAAGGASSALLAAAGTHALSSSALMHAATAAAAVFSNASAGKQWEVGGLNSSAIADAASGGISSNNNSSACWATVTPLPAEGGSSTALFSAAWTYLVAFGGCAELWTAAGLLLSHFFGAACYVTHWPQKRFPRTFDVCVSAVWCNKILAWV